MNEDDFPDRRRFLHQIALWATAIGSGIATRRHTTLNQQFFDAATERRLYSFEYELQNQTPEELARKLLFGNENQISALASTNNPFMAKGVKATSAFDTLRSIVARLGLAESHDRLAITPTRIPAGLSLFTGGPVESAYARVILGRGYGSPLLSLLGPESRNLLPVSYDLRAQNSNIALKPYSDRKGARPDWPLFVKGRAIVSSSDFLLITSLPNPYSPAHRLLSISGKHGAGARAIDNVLANPKLVEHLYRASQHLTGWQILVEVPKTKNERPVGDLGQTDIFEVNYDFDKLASLLEGRPLFGHPNIEEFSGALGLLGMGSLVSNQEPTFHRSVELPPETDLERNERLQISSQMETNTKNKESARSFLRRAGILTKTNNVERIYHGIMEAVDENGSS